MIVCFIDTINNNTSSNKTSESGSSDDINNKILELARQQRMNTEVRRNIFCAIATSDVSIGADPD